MSDEELEDNSSSKIPYSLIEHLKTDGNGIKEKNQRLIEIFYKTKLEETNDSLFVARLKLRTLVPTEVVYKIKAKNDDEFMLAGKFKECSVSGEYFNHVSITITVLLNVLI